MNNQSGYPAQAVTSRALAAQSHKRAASLAAQALEAERVSDAWRSLHDYVERGWHLHVIDLLGAGSGSLSLLASS